jgi:predicted mannosyl-3-phosphoglycerate phosphatase (HAD superfamily)
MRKTNKKLLIEIRKLRSSVSKLKRIVKVFRAEEKEKEERAKWTDLAREQTRLKYPE